MNQQDVFPALAGFPDAELDVARVSRDTTVLRLVAGANNLASLQRLNRLERLWCFGLNATTLPIVGSLANLRRLYIDGIRAADLTSLATT